MLVPQEYKRKILLSRRKEEKDYETKSLITVQLTLYSIEIEEGSKWYRATVHVCRDAYREADAQIAASRSLIKAYYEATKLFEEKCREFTKE